jgi:hypothetical protein
MRKSGFAAVMIIVFLSAVCACSSQSGVSAEAKTDDGAAKLNTEANIIFLHHSTGNNVWNGGVPAWFSEYNAANGTSYKIIERAFPSGDPYAWKNYPFDYWNIWVEHAGSEPYMEEPTLEMLTPEYDVIVFKHCYPVSNVLEDTGSPDIASEVKTAENYKLQYAALKDKLHQFPDVKFIVWTGAALVEKNTNPENAARARAFFQWVKDEWDQPGDNIYLWDLFELETGGGLYLKNEYAEAEDNSHPNAEFCKMAAPQFAQRIVDVIQGKAE